MSSAHKDPRLQTDSDKVNHADFEHTTNRTFRLLRSAALLLDKESREEGKSVNAIINQLIMKDLRADRADRQLNPVLLPSICVRELIENIPDEKIVEVANDCAKDALMRYVLLEVDGVASAKSVFDTMRLYNDVTVTENDGKKIAILAHYAGVKYSLFSGTMYKTLFAQVGAKVEFSTDDNAVVFELGQIS